MRTLCDYCGHPAPIRHLVFAKGDNPPPERRAEDSVGKVCLGCLLFLRAHPEAAGLPRSCRHDALEEYHWGVLRTVMADMANAPDLKVSEDEVFGGLK